MLMNKIFNIILFLSFSINCFSQIANPRAWAEFEETKGIIVNQPYKWGGVNPDKPDWAIKTAEGYDSVYVKLIDEALSQNIDVYYLLDTTSSYYYFDPAVLDTMAHRYGINIKNPKFHVVGYDENIIHPDIWARDHGPMNVYENKVGTLHEILFKHGVIGSGKIVSKYLGIPTIEITDPATDGFCSMGGNYMVDGNTMAIVDEGRPQDKAQLPNYASLFGLDHVYTLPNYLGHIDMYMKLVNEETLLVSEQDPWNYTTGWEQYDYGEDSYSLNNAILYIQENVLSQYGRPMKVYRITNAPSLDSLDAGMSYMTSNATYINSFILNNAVFVPQYANQESDAEALKTYSRAMPGYKIIPVDCRYLVEYAGAIHCVVNAIATDEPIWIQHAWMPNNLNKTTDYKISANIMTKSGVKSATLFYKFNSKGSYASASMINLSDNNYIGYIPGQTYGTRVYYYIEVEANSGKKSRKPLVAPAWSYNFLVDQKGTVLSEKSYGKSDLSVNVFPDVTNEKIQFNFNDFRGTKYEVEIYDLWGRLMTKDLATSNIEFNTSTFSPGYYLYVIKDIKSGEFKSGKFLKQATF
jgi:agmatine/peptidylarginine deiminase